METLKFEIESTATGRVDAEKGIVEGVSVISTPEAKEHNIKIDRASIESFAAAVEGKQIKAYYTHSPSNEALDSIGLWQNFEIKEEEEYTKLTADFVALESWKEHDPKNYDALFELAKKAPEAFGVSAEFQAKTIFYNEEGEEVEFSGEEEAKNFLHVLLRFLLLVLWRVLQQTQRVFSLLEQQCWKMLKKESNLQNKTDPWRWT